MKVRGLLPKLALLCASLLMSLAVGEVALRIMIARGVVSLDPAAFPLVPHRSAPIRSDNPVLFWELDPADSFINEDGFGDRKFERTRTPGTVRIVVLGDSVAFGYGVDPDESFPKALERELNSMQPGHEVLNFGVGGYNTVQEVEFYRVKAREWKPDVILLSYVLNDAMKPGNVLVAVRDKANRAKARTPRPKIFDFVRLRLRPKERTHRGGPAAVYVHDHFKPGYWRELGAIFADLAALAESDGARVAIAIVPVLSHLGDYPFTAIHRRIASQARRSGFAVFDLLEDLRGRDASALRFSEADLTHPNAAGHAAIAYALAGHLAREGMLANP